MQDINTIYTQNRSHSASFTLHLSQSLSAGLNYPHSAIRRSPEALLPLETCFLYWNIYKNTQQVVRI